jgi:deoxyribose-phosphate aldolase
MIKMLKLPQDGEAIRTVVSKAEIASLLVPSVQDAMITEICNDAKTYGTAGVLATAALCPQVSAALKGAEVRVVCIYSLIYSPDENYDCKIFGIKDVIKSGVKDFDLGVPAGVVHDKDFARIEKDFCGMADVIKQSSGHIGLVLETELFSYEEQMTLGKIAVNAGADYLRICSGMEQLCGINGGRATLRSICFLKDRFGDTIKIKAGGGWDYAYLEDCYEYIQSGADRVDAGSRFIKQLKDMNYGGK